MIISFAWTTPAVVIGEKTETRRDWSPKTIATARKIMERGGTFDAYDKSPRSGGKKIGTIRILDLIENEDTRQIPESSWEKEGFHILSVLGAMIGKSSAGDVWRFWKTENSQPLTVVIFDVISLTPWGKKLDYETRLTFIIDHGITLSKSRRIPLEEAI